MRRIVWTIFVAVAVALALAATGCGGSSGSKSGKDDVASVLAAVDGLTGKARTDRLLALARDEGGLTFYTSYTTALLEEVASAFKDAYGIDVSTYKAGSGDVMQRLLEESNAGFHGADAVENNGLLMVDASERGLLEPYDSPSSANLIDGAVHKSWTADAVNTLALIWNTKLVPTGSQPRSWADLADPRWKGKVAIAVDEVAWYKTLRDYWIERQGVSPQQADRLFEAIARNALFIKGHTLGLQLQAAGEFGLSVNLVHVAEDLIRKGAPLAWKPAIEPVIVRTDGVGVVRGAPHPAAALLFVDWLLHDGQKILAKYGVAVRKDLVATGHVETAVVDLEAVAAHQTDLTDRFDRLARLGGKVGGSG